MGNDLANTIVGVAPAGTAGVKPGPAGNDVLVGSGGNDLLLGAEGNDFEVGGAGNDVLLGAGGNDLLVGEAGVDNFSAGDGQRQRTSPATASPRRSSAGSGPTASRPTRSTRRPPGDCETFNTAP